MILFFRGHKPFYYVIETLEKLNSQDQEKLCWLLGNAEYLDTNPPLGRFIGPRKEMITPWSTNAVEITQNMGIRGILRMEQFEKAAEAAPHFDPMLQVLYEKIDQDIFKIDIEPAQVIEIDNIAAYNQSEGLALSDEEVAYLEEVSKKLNRKLTDSEIFGFSQVNSEHCRHKIFNGTFIIDGEEKPESLFRLIKKTSQENPNFLVSAYKDNVAFVKGPFIEQFAPKTQDKPDFFQIREVESVISLKAETHNFPTTVEPFNGAATGSGGEIRDRLAGGKGSLPLAGTAVYMTSYPRLEGDRPWEKNIPPRPWLYQTPLDILIKASDGASDFGNKFGQPLICGSVLTFEHQDNHTTLGFDKVIMQAGGVGFGTLRDSAKGEPKAGDKVVILGGDNYRIGMGGSAVSSVATGEFANKIELNAIQRSNPEMQKRAMNAIRAMVESDNNPIVSIHDHGAGGHLNCLSELLEATGGTIDMAALPVGDPTLSDKEIIGNESQERMGLVMHPTDLDQLKAVADRERAPMYVVGEATGDMQFRFENKNSGKNPVDLHLSYLFGSSPKTILTDETQTAQWSPVQYQADEIARYLVQVLQLEAVACKDWLTNKVDRSVTGKVALQQTVGSIQLPLNNLGVMALDYQGKFGVATAIGHAPVASLIDEVHGARMAITKCLTNLVWAPLTHGLKGVSLSANWMWPAKNKGEDARLYKAVKAVSDFACELGINIPTGKDSLSMTQKYPDGKKVISPGTVIISGVAEVSQVRHCITPALKNIENSQILYIDLSQSAFRLGGSSFAQILNQLGNECPEIASAAYVQKVFAAIQGLMADGKALAGHDVSAGGLVTTLLEMCFPQPQAGMKLNLTGLRGEQDLVKILFSENPAIILQVSDGQIAAQLKSAGIEAINLGEAVFNGKFHLDFGSTFHTFSVETLRDEWFRTSWRLDQKQRGPKHADARFENYKQQPLSYRFPKKFTGQLSDYGLSLDRKATTGRKAAIIREKGVNGDREMAWCLHLAGFDVKDVHMTDLTSGREDLSDVQMIVFVGGFSNSDVLGSAKGWAGAFLYNELAKTALDNFYDRDDTLSLGVCNGCQLMMELGLLYREEENHPKMHHNASGKFESSFVNLEIPENNSVMLKSLSGTRLGVWLAHGEGRFKLDKPENHYPIAAKYAYSAYPANPNGSDYDVAAMCSADGRHLAMMPHLERSLYRWNWADYPANRPEDEVTPWIEAFVNARQWIENRKGN
jgi:phosphoribosylformylglycinamidine synthase